MRNTATRLRDQVPELTNRAARLRDQVPQLTNRLGRKGVLTVSGLAVAAGVAAGPAIISDPPVPAGASSAPVTQVTDTTTGGAAPGSAGQAAPGNAGQAGAGNAGQAAANQARARVPVAQELMPRPVTGGQQQFTPSGEQMRNAQSIIETGQKLGLPPRAWVIAVATSLQESTLHNYGHLGARNDHDSQGLFQQRPSSGWGSPKQITNPEYSATKFYQALARVDGWENMPLTRAAQKVQVSAYPNHYAKWEQMSADLVLAQYGHGPHAGVAAKTGR